MKVAARQGRKEKGHGRRYVPGVQRVAHGGRAHLANEPAARRADITSTEGATIWPPPIGRAEDISASTPARGPMGAQCSVLRGGERRAERRREGASRWRLWPSHTAFSCGIISRITLFQTLSVPPPPTPPPPRVHLYPYAVQYPRYLRRAAATAADTERVDTLYVARCALVNTWPALAGAACCAPCARHVHVMHDVKRSKNSAPFKMEQPCATFSPATASRRQFIS